MDNLNVFVSSQPNNQQPVQDKVRNFFSVPKIIFAILGLVILAELIYAVRTLTAPTPPLPVRQTAVSQTVAKMSLNAPKTIFNVNETVPVSVTVDSGGHEIDGADLIVRFDPKVLEATPAGIVKGEIFAEYPLQTVDSKQGLISISGISGLQKNFNGTGQFATLNLRAKTPGKTSLTISFSQGSTTDSNLVETATSKNILEQVDNLELEII